MEHEEEERSALLAVGHGRPARAAFVVHWCACKQCGAPGPRVPSHGLCCGVSGHRTALARRLEFLELT